MMQMFGDIFVVMPDAGLEDARRRGRYCGDRDTEDGLIPVFIDVDILAGSQ